MFSMTYRHCPTVSQGAKLYSEGVFFPLILCSFRYPGSVCDSLLREILGLAFRLGL